MSLLGSGSTVRGAKALVEEEEEVGSMDLEAACFLPLGWPSSPCAELLLQGLEIATGSPFKSNAFALAS